MANDALNQYRQNEVLSATPLKLVVLLYEGAVESISQARAWLRAGQIAERTRAINRAMTLVNELALSLDRSQGGELSLRLADLYAYVQKRLLEGNFRQTEAPLEEAERLLRTLLEGWQRCAEQETSASASFEPAAAEYQPISCAG
jgi:flagellar protein FliS